MVHEIVAYFQERFALEWSSTVASNRFTPRTVISGNKVAAKDQSNCPQSERNSAVKFSHRSN